MAISQNWNLDDLFPGGSSSPQFKTFIQNMEKEIHRFEEMLKHQKSIKECLLVLQFLTENLSQAHAFVGCLLSQNVEDHQAEILENEISNLDARFNNACNLFDQQLKALSESEFDALIADPKMTPIAFPLQERRRRTKDQLPLDQENLINELSVDGYHGWSQLYGSYIGQVKIPFKKETYLSWGQAYNLLSDPNRETRRTIFENSNKVWEAHQNVFTSILNRIAGYRLKLYEKRDWPILKETLELNRIQSSTLDTMWRVIEKNKRPFIKYQNRKAQLLGLKKLSWFDLEAPLQVEAPQDVQAIPYDEAAAQIIDKFSTFSPEMGEYAKRAFEQRWIEAENRPGKRPGGFCTDVPLNKASRIFMTFSGTRESVLTLAHELGHGFHNHVIFSQPVLARNFPMTLAETASTFAEMLISEAALKQETSPQKKLLMLDGRVQRAIIFLCNIHARFLFELRFHEERQRGFVAQEKLCAMMEAAQKEAYCDTLEVYHPWFWASKMHFSSTGMPFYNYPYTFGYLLSLGIYLKAHQESSFENSYISFLADTGRMPVEELAQKHLGEDLGKEAFWQSILDFLNKDIEEFLACSKLLSPS